MSTKALLNDKKLEESKKEEENKALAIFYYIIGGVAIALNYVFAKKIYETRPETTPF